MILQSAGTGIESMDKSADTGIRRRLQAVRKRITDAARASGRDPESVGLVAVSKTMDAEKVRQAIEAGATTLGENYVQEARDKITQLASYAAEWHFIGHLQSNKVKYAVRLFGLIHSVDSLKLAREIDRQAAKIRKIQPVLIQVNISREESKSGVCETEALELATEMDRLENLSVTGLMTVPPFFNAPEKVRPYFRSLRRLRDRIADANLARVAMNHLSMGMTGDFEVAIQEGATLVRVGTAIFGSRP